MEANTRRNAWSEEFPSTSAHVTIPFSSYSVSLYMYHEALGEWKVLWKTCASTLSRFIVLVSNLNSGFFECVVGDGEQCLEDSWSLNGTAHISVMCCRWTLCN